MTDNPYAVERTTFHYGRANAPGQLPDDMVLTLVRLAGTDYFETFVNGEQLGALHRNEDFITRAADFVAQGKA